MLGSCRLNNKSMRNVRRTDAYQAMAIDLALLGVITKEECEMLLDGGIPSGIVLPDGSSKLTSEEKLPPKPDFIQTEPVNADTQDTVNDNVDNVEPSPDPADNVDNVEPSPDPADNVDTEGNGDITMNGDDVNFTQSYSTGDAAETQEPVNDEGNTESNN